MCDATRARSDERQEAIHSSTSTHLSGARCGVQLCCAQRAMRCGVQGKVLCAACDALWCGAMRCAAVRCGALCCGVACRAVRCGVLRCGAVRCGVVRRAEWCGAVRCGAVRCGVVWCGVVWRAMHYGVVRCDAVRCAACGVLSAVRLRCGVLRCGVLWCAVVWCGRVCVLRVRMATFDKGCRRTDTLCPKGQGSAALGTLLAESGGWLRGRNIPSVDAALS